MDYRTLEIVQGLREIADELIQKQDIHDKRLKEIEDNFHNQEPKEFDAPGGGVNYASAGKDSNREDIKGEDTKETITNASVQKGEYNFDSDDDDDDEDEEVLQKSIRKGKKLAKASVRKGGRMLRKHDMDEHMGQVDVDDVPMDMDEDYMPDDGESEEVDEIREMYKQSMSMMKGILKSQMKQTDYLVKKLEELSKSREDDRTESGPQLLSTLPVRKSLDENMAHPMRQLGGGNESLQEMNTIVQDYDNTLDMIVKGAVNSHGDVSEHALARINQWRLDLGDLETPALPTYNSGIPGMA